MKKEEGLKGSQTQRRAFGVPSRSNEALGFWLCAGLLAVLLASILARDIDIELQGLKINNYCEIPLDKITQKFLFVIRKI